MRDLTHESQNVQVSLTLRLNFFQQLKEKGVMKHFPLQSQPLNTDISSRTRTPTILVEGRSNITVRTAAKRRLETMKAASRIHGGSENNPSPALDGMFDTLVQYRLNPYVHWPRVSRGGRKGSARVLPFRPPREERTKHKTKPRRSLGKHAFFNGRVFVLLIAFVCSLFVFHC